MPDPKTNAAPDPGALSGCCCPLMFCVMTRTHPWIERISDRFFEVSFDAAFRRTVRRYLKRKRMSARAFGRALHDATLAKRLAEGRPVRLDTADKGFEFMGEPPLRTLFVQEIEAYLQITGTKGYVLGLEAVGDRSFVTNMREGLSPYLGSIDKVRRWMGAHSSAEERRAIGAATLHRSWFRLGVGGRDGHGQGAPAADDEQGYLSTKQAGEVPGREPQEARPAADRGRGSALLQIRQQRALPARGPGRVGARAAAPEHVRGRHGAHAAGAMKRRKAMDWRTRGAGIARALGAAASAAMPMAPLALSYLVAALPLLGGMEAVWATTDTTFAAPLTTVTDMVGGTGGQLAAVLAVGAALVGSVLRFNATQIMGAVGVGVAAGAGAGVVTSLVGTAIV